MQSLRSALIKYGSLTPKQYAAAEKFFNAPAQATYSGVLPSIPAFLSAALTNLKWPKYHFAVGDLEMVLRLKGQNSAHPGAVDIVSRERFWNDRFQSEMPDWYGRIDADGTVTLGGKMAKDILAAVVEIACDPKAAAVKYAARTGSCSFCGRYLETKESVSVGYGPVCAQKFGLPWGEIREFTQADEDEMNRIVREGERAADRLAYAVA